MSVALNLASKARQLFIKFYFREHETAILSIADSEKLGLVKVNFDMIDKSNNVKLIHSMTSESFKKKIETKFPELFKGIRCMEGEILMKLCDGAIPHTEPIRHEPHAMQQTLKDELDKFCKEKILHKWLNSFVCVNK